MNKPAIESIICGGTIVNYVDGCTEWLRDGKVVMIKTPDGAYRKFHDDTSPIDYEIWINCFQSIYYRNGVVEMYNHRGELLKRVDPNVERVRTWAQVASGK
jgi:hypothetical protein